MKGTSKVIMCATLVMLVSLALVLGLILVLLAELYCSLLLRRRQLRNNNSNSNTLPTTQTATTTRANASSPSQTRTSYPQQHSSPPPPLPFSSIHAQGVLQPPRTFLLPEVACKEDDIATELKKHRSELHQLLVQIQTQESNASPRQVGLLSAPSPPASSFIYKATPELTQQSPLQGSGSGRSLCPDKSCNGGDEHLVYISNPIYENEESKASGSDTPFETPDTSPSRLERSGSSGEDDHAAQATSSPCGTHSPPSPYTPPLTPMKKLPAEACSVSLRDARSLGTSGSDSRSNNCVSSSSSGSPCTSPSW